MTISVTADLQYAINNTPVPADQLEAAIEQAIKGQPDPTALLKVDKTVQVQNLVDLLDIGNRKKKKMVLATQTSSSSKWLRKPAFVRAPSSFPYSYTGCCFSSCCLRSCRHPFLLFLKQEAEAE